ncbi:MAG: GTP-binding protein [Candidatus Asgardarchaeia archaeon]
MRIDGKKLDLFLVFWGPPGAGKTTILEYLYNKVPFSKKGDLVKIEDEKGSTMMFDFAPFVIIPEERGTLSILFHCYTVPGQDAYEERREILLSNVKDVDAFVFVADSQITRIKDNIESYKELKGLCVKVLGKNLEEDIPVVVFLNKRDLPNAIPLDLFKKIMGSKNPIIETVGITGDGVIKGFKVVSQIVLKSILKVLS